MKRNGKPTNLYLCQDIRRDAQRLAKINGESLSDLVERALVKLLKVQQRKEAA